MATKISSQLVDGVKFGPIYLFDVLGAIAFIGVFGFILAEYIHSYVYWFYLVWIVIVAIYAILPAAQNKGIRNYKAMIWWLQERVKQQLFERDERVSDNEETAD
ncbi:DUF5592 family protein [Culicoidibacter larvae]|uniref:Uncharacterized protein n=1 Tax=Culicoidibacter larvae TaxID=2579976 RepID=A0A5R8Q6W8_9FIRM|nr:DUF5592 family protein [Culicoidibacter larvae]TLG71159.1 hypothetical protein FEZ08_11435 [Culicoidibacter larvae]